MDDKVRRCIQLNCLYEMFRDRVEEDVVYIVYSENEGKIDITIDQLMSIDACSFTGHFFEQKPSKISKVEEQQQDHKCEVRKLKLKQVVEVEEDETTLTIEEQIEGLQKCIDDLLLEKKSTHDKASQYLSKKMYPVTGYYSELGSQLRRLIEDKTNKLVDLLLQKSKNSNTIDLHGLNPVQARLVVNELLKLRQSKLMIDKQGETSIDIITGWGKHKVTHGHRIRPTIVALLREKHFEFHHLNRGALRVTIRR